MNRSATVRRTLAALIAIAALSSPLLAQGPPRSEFTNLKVLPKDIAPEDLHAMMNGFTRALGVRCIHCHVGEEGKPFTKEDFAKDDKPTKLKAREMIRMTQDLNDKYLANLANRAEPQIRVKCVTCHHGVTQPRPLEDVLKMAYDTGGMDSTLARYQALRDHYYGRFSYDFGEVPLTELAGKVRTAGNQNDALQLLAFNVEMNPKSTFAKRQYSASSLALAFATGADSGAAVYGRLKERYGPAVINEGLVNGIGYDLIGAGKTDAAITAFAFNVAQNPQSANAYDSMGEGYYQKGDHKQAVAAYQKSLQLDPTNQNAIDRLKELKAKPKAAKKG